MLELPLQPQRFCPLRADHRRQCASADSGRGIQNWWGKLSGARDPTGPHRAAQRTASDSPVRAAQWPCARDPV